MHTTFDESIGSMRRAVLLVPVPRNLALQRAEILGELGETRLRRAQLCALAVRGRPVAAAGAPRRVALLLLQLFHTLPQVRHLLLGERERGDRVAHRRRRLLQHRLRRGRLGAKRLLRVRHGHVEVVLGHLRRRSSTGEEDRGGAKEFERWRAS